MNRQRIGLVLYVFAVLLIIWALLNCQKASLEAGVLQEAIEQYCELKTGNKSNEGYSILEDGILQINCLSHQNSG